MSNETPPPGVTAVAKKKSSWLFVGLGCLGLIILMAIGAEVLVGIGAKKVVKISQEAATDPEKFAAEMMVKANPEVELVVSDPNAGTMTIREKETGRETTLTYKNIAAGKIVIQQDKKEISMEPATADQPAAVVIKDETETAAISDGNGGERLPDWIPVYPGWTISSDGGFHVKTNEDSSGSVAGTTRDDVKKVSGYYKDTMEKAGFKCTETFTNLGDVEMSSVNARNEAVGEEITVSIQKDKDRPEATVTLVYQSKNP